MLGLKIMTDTFIVTEDNITPSLTPYIVIFCGSLFFFFEFMQVNVFNSLTPFLFNAFHANSTDIGKLATAYIYGNVLFLLPAGLLLDRFSTRQLIMIATLICSLGTLAFSLTHVLWQAQICRFITGLTGSFCLISNVRLASRWFPAHRMALIIGLIVLFAMLGAVVAQTPFTVLITHLGWRQALWVDVAMGLLVMLFVWRFVKDYPPGSKKKYQRQTQQTQQWGYWKSLFNTLSKSQNWLAGIYASLINLPLFLLGASWGNLYLMQANHLSQLQASNVSAMLFSGMIAGSPFIGWLSDRIRLRKLPMIVGALCCLAIITLILLLPLNYQWLMSFFFLLGFVCSSQVLAYPTVAESNPSALIASAESIISITVMAGGFLIAVFPLLLNWHWKHIVIDQVPVYSRWDYLTALSMIVIGFFIAILCCLFIKETHGRSFEQQ